MTVDSVIGARAKLHRASEHLEQLKAQMDADFKADLYGFTVHDDLNTREGVIVYRMPADLSARYGVLVGEVVGQIRSALEHVIWRLVPAPEDHVTGFPVYRDSAKYVKDGKKKINGINPSAAAIIEGLQPFNNGGTASELFILHELWNRDKHRLLNLSSVTVLGVQPLYAFPNGLHERGVLLTAEARDFEDGAEILRFAHPDFYQPPRVQVKVVAAYTVKFGDAGAATGQSPTELLSRLLKFGENLVNALAATI